MQNIFSRIKFHWPKGVHNNLIGNENKQEYGKLDGVLAIAFYIFNFLSIYFWSVSLLGKQIRKDIFINSYYSLLNFLNILNLSCPSYSVQNWASLISALPSDFIPVVAIVIIAVIRKQKFSSLGFRKHHNLHACLLGISVGALTALLMYCILFFEGKRDVFGHLVELRFSVFLLVSTIVCTGFTEELEFRVFIHSRIFGVIRKEWIAILTVGILFWVSHVFNYFSDGPIPIPDLILSITSSIAFSAIAWFVYKRSGNLLAPVLFHGIYDYLIYPIYF